MLNVPHFRQVRAFTCGPACLRMVLAYYEIADTEADISDAVGCTADAGTSPANMARYLRKRGFVAHSRTNCTLADIKADIKRGRVPIIAYQAHGGPGVDLSTTLLHGHYSIVVGVTGDRVTLCDPSAKTKHTHLDAATFLERWNDIDARGKQFFRWALTVRPKH